MNISFWDWLLPKTQDEGLPVVCRQEKIKIAAPNGAMEEVPNPLFCYHFAKIFRPPNVQGADKPGHFDKWARTYRWPTDVPVAPKEQYDVMDKYGRVSLLSSASVNLPPVECSRTVASLL